MELVGIQIASISFGLCLIYLTYLYYKRGYLGKASLITWAVTLGAFIFLALFPQTLAPFAKVLKVARIFDLFVILTMVLLLTLGYTNFIYMQKLKNKLENYIQNKALEENDDRSHQAIDEKELDETSKKEEEAFKV